MSDIFFNDTNKLDEDQQQVAYEHKSPFDVIDEQKKQNQENYKNETGLPSAPAEFYRQMDNFLTTHPGENDMQQAAARLAAAQMYQKYFPDQSISDIYNNIDSYNKAFFGTKYDKKGDEIQPFNGDRVSNWQALKDAWQRGVNNLEKSGIGEKLIEAEKFGDPQLIEEAWKLVEQMNQLEETYAPVDQERNGFIKALEVIAESAPFTLESMAAGAVGTAVGILNPAAGAAVSGVLGFSVSQNATIGNEYITLREQGNSPDVAYRVACTVGTIESLAEAIVGTASEYAFSKGLNAIGNKFAQIGAEKIAAALNKDFRLSNGMQKAVRMAVEYGLEATGETLEEVVQELTEIVGENVAAVMSEMEIPHDDAEEIWLRVKDSAIGGLIGAVGFGAPRVVVNVGLDRAATVRNSKAIATAAQEIQSESVFMNEMKKVRTDDAGNEYRIADIILSADEADLNDKLHDIYQGAAAARQETNFSTTAEYTETNTNAEGFEQTEITEDDNGNIERNITPVVRNAAGELDTENVTYQNDDGSVTGSYRVGTTTKEKENLYGYIDYILNENDRTVVINTFSMADVRESLRQEVFDNFAADFAGYEITWNTKSRHAAEIKNSLINNNLNGKRNGLNYYKDESDVVDSQIRRNVAKEVRQNIKNISQYQIPAAVAFMESLAKSRNMTLSDWYTKVFNGQIFGDTAEAQQIAASIGESWNNKAGATAWKKIGDDFKAVIYAGEKADFSTFVHEVTHAWQNELSRAAESGDENAVELLQKIEKAFNVQDHNWYRSTVRDINGKRITSDEALAYGIQDYLKSGKAKNNEIADVLKQLAIFMARCLNSLAQHIELTKDVMDAYDAMMSGDDTMLAKAYRDAQKADREIRSEEQRATEKKQQAEQKQKEEADKQKQQHEKEKSETNFSSENETDVETKEKTAEESYEEKLKGNMPPAQDINSEVEELNQTEMDVTAADIIQNIEEYTADQMVKEDIESIAENISGDNWEDDGIIGPIFQTITDPAEAIGVRQIAGLAAAEESMNVIPDGEPFKTEQEISDFIDTLTARQRNRLNFQIIGELGATNLDRMEEVTTRMDNLETAKEMFKAGKTVERIRLATGWEMTIDGKWRYEIKDDYHLKNNRKTNRKLKRYEEELKQAEKALAVYTEATEEEAAKIRRKIEVAVQHGAMPEGTTFESQQQEAQNKVDMYKNLIEFDGDLDVEKSLKDFIENGVADPNNFWDIGESFYLNQIIDNEELFKAYPQLEHYVIEFTKKQDGHSGRLNPEDKVITIYPPAVSSYAAFKSTLAHEVQHAIQHIEGFAEGGSENTVTDSGYKEFMTIASKAKELAEKVIKADEKLQSTEEYKSLNNVEYFEDKYEELSNIMQSTEEYKQAKDLEKEFSTLYPYFNTHELINDYKNHVENVYQAHAGDYGLNPYQMYKRIAGEVEARNVQRRLNMSDVERLNTLLLDTEDVARDQQIVMYEATRMAAVEEEQLEKTEAEKQIEDVRKQYEGTDKWMKAPNGADTKLTEKQWLQVRTANFKRWFGNWELGNKQFNIVQLEKAEFNNKVDGLEWAVNNNIIGLMSNEETGGKGFISITKKSVDEMLNAGQREKSPSNEVHYAALIKIKDIIRESEIVDNHPDYKKNKEGKRTPIAGINKDVNIDVLYGAIEFDNQIYRVKTTVKRFVDKNANSKAYAYSVEKIEVLAGKLSNAKSTTPNANTSITGNSLLQGVYKVNQETGGNGKLALDDYSKVLDENGEPLVVYHGTIRKGFKKFSIFDTSLAPSWFTPSKNYAEEYFSEKKKYQKGDLYPVFLNIRNFKEVGDIDWGGSDTLKTISESTDIPLDELEAQGFENTSWRWQVTNDKKFKDLLIMRGFDGIKAYEAGVDSYAVFNPNQIKSATDNNGNFDENNSDILFQTAYHGTAADFDKFDTERYGLSGEGSMSFGYGTYVAGEEEIARDYAQRQYTQKFDKESKINRLNSLKERTAENESKLKVYESQEAFYQDRDNSIQRLQQDIDADKAAGKNTAFLENILADIPKQYTEENRLMYIKSFTAAIEQDQKEIAELEAQIKDIEKAETEGAANRYLYTVDIPDNGFIKWDKTVPKSTRSRIVNELYHTLIKGDYAGAERELRYELQPMVDTPLNGQEIYQNIWTYLGSDKDASDFLYNLGYSGIDYPAGTNFGTDIPNARNYVIFNDADAKIINKMSFQTLDELYNDAMQYATWQEFMDAYEMDFNPEELEKPGYHNQVPSDADAQWYQTTWELAHKITPEESTNKTETAEKYEKEGPIPTVLDAMFDTDLETNPDMLDDFLRRIYEILQYNFNSEEFAHPADEEEYNYFNKLMELQDFLNTRLSDVLIRTNADVIGKGGQISNTARQSIITRLRNRSREYRALYAELMENEQYAVDEEDLPRNYLAKKLRKYNLVSPNEDLERKSIDEIGRLAEELSNREIARKIVSKTLRMDDELYNYVQSLTDQIKDLQNKYDALEKETTGDYQRIADDEKRKLLKLHEKLLIAKGKYKKRNDSITRMIDKGLKISGKYRENWQNLKADYDEIFRKYADLYSTVQITAEVEQALKRQEQLAGLREDLNAKQQEKNTSNEIKRLRTQLVKRTLRRVPFDKIDYDSARTIIAIQRMLEPNLLGGVNRWIGTEGPYLRGVISGIITDDDYKKEIMNYLKRHQKASKAFADFMKLLENTKSIADFEKWTKKDREKAIRYLPKENWIKDLKLNQLAKEREESIDLDIDMIPKTRNMTDENGNVIYNKDGTPKTVSAWEVKASDEINDLVRNAVGIDMFNNIISRPFAEWTTEELEQLAVTVNSLYVRGRDVLAAKKLQQIESAEKLRKQIETAIKETGITINEDDTPEEKQKKQEKINKILGYSNDVKGTVEIKKQSKINRLLHSYSDANILRVARILDNNAEGVNVSLLYKRENDAYTAEQKNINSRAEKIQNFMKENKLDIDELSRSIDINGLKFTVDELLYVLAADDDHVDDINKIAKGAIPGTVDANDNYAASSRNAVMFGNMFSASINLEDRAFYESLDKDLQRRIENNALTEDEKNQLESGMLDKKPGTTMFISRCQRIYEAVLAAARNIENENPVLKQLRDIIAQDYAEQYDRMNQISIQEFNSPVHRVANYVPLVRLESNGDLNVNQVKEDLLGADGIGKQWVNKGMTKRRVNVSPLYQRPVQMGLYKTWADSVARTEHFINYAGLVRELNRVYKSRDASTLRQQIESRYGRGMTQYLDQYINEIANPNVLKARSAGGEFIRNLRGATAGAYLSWKASAIIKQGLTSPWPYMQFISPKQYLAAAWDCIRTKGSMYESIREKSVYMKNRVMDPMNDLITELAENTGGNKISRKLAKINKKGMAGLEWIDWVSVAPGWLACYRQKFAEIDGKNTDIYEATKLKLQEENLYMDVASTQWKSAEQIEAIALQAMKDDAEKQAVDYADKCTRECQPSNRSVDIAPLFKSNNEFQKAVLQFQTSLNVIWQNLRYDIPFAVKTRQFKRIVGMTLGYTLAGIFMNSVMNGIRHKDGADDNDEKAVRDFIWYATTQFTDSVPVIGNYLSNSMQKVITGKGNVLTGGVDMTPMVSKFLKSVENASAAVLKDDKSYWIKAARNFGDGVAMNLGLPTSGTAELLKIFGIGDKKNGLGIHLDEVYKILKNIEGKENE